MLKTCARCRSRRAKCDARLPSCLNCHKSSQPCTYYDEVLKENIPRSRLKSLYDKIDELSALVSMHQSHAERSESAVLTSPSTRSYLDPFTYIVPYRTNQYLFLGPSPPVVLGNVTITKLLQLGAQIESPAAGYTSEHERLAVTAVKYDRNSVSPSIVRSLLEHYTKCIEPTYSTGMFKSEDYQFDLKQLSEDARCAVLLACAIAAAHKSYHLPSWRALGTACREWAGELAQPLIERRDDYTVFILIMFIVYELADPERGLIWDFLSTATRICIQLGWHRVDEDGQEPVEGVADDYWREFGWGNKMNTETRRRLFSVLLDIERDDRFYFFLNIDYKLTT